MKLLFLKGASLGLVLALAGCSGNRLSLPSDDVIVQKKTSAAIHPQGQYFLGQVQVGLNQESQLATVVENLQAQGIEVALLDKVPSRPIYLLEINSTQTVDQVVSALKQDKERVLTAAKSYRMESSFLRANDPLLRSQWAVQNFGQEAPRALAGKVGSDIGMGGVTAEGNHDVVVGVIDTGVDYYHEDLAITEVVDGKRKILAGSNIWINPEEIADNNINDDNNGDPENGIRYTDDVYGYNFVGRTGDSMDDQGHGTHVAGVIGALRNNFKGIVGINQKVSLMGLKFLSAEGSGSDWDAQLAIYYAIDMKKKYPNKRFVLTNSWGSAGRSSKNGDEDDHLLRAFAEASANDILIVAAAGNDATSNRFFEHFPSNYSNKIENMLSVAATNNLDNLAAFSSYGYENVQVAAPGVLIQSTVPAALYDTPYEAWSGTSMATPHVTGLAALLWSENMGWTASQVRQRIMDTVDVLPQLHGVVSTAGRINVKRALAGDINVSTQPVVQEEEYVVSSPRPTNPASFDLLTKIESAGAKEVAVCFDRINLVGNGDWIEILDETYRVVDTIQGYHKAKNWQNKDVELCSAPVRGDKLFVRLAGDSHPDSIRGFQTKSIKTKGK